MATTLRSWLTLALATPSRSAAPVKLPAATTAAKIVRLLRSIWSRLAMVLD
jgi:hypothetical protein